MYLQRLWRWLDRPRTNSGDWSGPPRRTRLMVELLEERAVPASYTAATAPELIGAITAANQSAEADTITLAPGATFTLKQAYGLSHFAMTGLPPITTAGGPLTIVGNGDIIERSTARKVPAFRLVTVEAGADLTLINLTLQGGLVSNGGGDIYNVGGGIYNAGTLTLNGVTVQRNTVKSEFYTIAAGGGIYSIGQLTLNGCLIQDNQAIGGDGSNGGWIRDPREGRYYSPPAPGGSASGGGVYVSAGTASLLETTVTNNTARGGLGGNGRDGRAADGLGVGGGVYISASAFVSLVSLDAFTVDHVMSNLADIDPDIHGSFTIV